MAEISQNWQKTWITHPRCSTNFELEKLKKTHMRHKQDVDNQRQNENLEAEGEKQSVKCKRS